MARTGEWLIRIAGALVFAGAFAHAFGGLHQLMGELPADTPHATRMAVAAGWVFGSFMMLAIGALVLFARGRKPADGARARTIPLAAGLAYAGYGGWALVYTGMRPHFWGFVAIGLMLLAGVALSGRGVQARTG